MDDFDLGVLRRIVHGFFHDNKILTVAKINRRFDDDDKLSSVNKATLNRMLKKLGLRFKCRFRNCRLIETANIVLWRCQCLRKIQALRRQRRPIFYTDETGVNSGHTHSRVSADVTVIYAREANHSGISTGFKKPSGKAGKVIVRHVGNKNGFSDGAGEVFRAEKASGDYHEEISFYFTFIYLPQQRLLRTHYIRWAAVNGNTI